MGSATYTWSNVLQPSIGFFDTVTAAVNVTVNGCSGQTTINATLFLKIVAKYFDANGAYISGADKYKTLGSHAPQGSGSVNYTYQQVNYNAGLWVAGNRPANAVKAVYHYEAYIGGYSPCPTGINKTESGPDSDWVTW